MITDFEFQQIVNYIKEKYGIKLQEKKVLVVGRLENYLVRNDIDSYSELMNKVRSDPGGTIANDLINALTTNHTYFMREFEHMEFLKSKVLPYLKQKESASRDLRIWCGASSSGEEPYTIAMVLQDFFGLENEKWDTTVLATDISTRVLQHAQKGVYLNEQVEVLPESWKRRFFKKYNSDSMQVNEILKKEVLFRQFNLMNPLPFRRKLHVVFLRNVMIYFDEDTKADLVNRIYDFMEPGGYLFIGTTETIDRSRTKYTYIQPSIYRKV